jgi:hypothetical protein
LVRSDDAPCVDGPIAALRRFDQRLIFAEIGIVAELE